MHLHRVFREPKPAPTAKLMFTHRSKEMFRFELDRLMGGLDRRIGEQRKRIETHASVSGTDARLRVLGECRNNQLALRGFAAP